MNRGRAQVFFRICWKNSVANVFSKCVYFVLFFTQANEKEQIRWMNEVAAATTTAEADAVKIDLENGRFFLKK